MKELEPEVKAQMATYIRHLNHGTPDATELRATLNFLAAIMEVAERINAAVGAKFSSQDIETLDTAAHKFFVVQGEIKRARMLIDDEVKHYELNLEELNAKGFSSDEIERILPFPVEKINEADAQIADLQNQAAELADLIDNSPVFNRSILEGIDVAAIRERFL